MRSVLATAVATPLLLAGVAGALAPAASADAYTSRPVTIKVSGSMTNTYSVSPVPTPNVCSGTSSGFQGSGTEKIEWSSTRSGRGTLNGKGKVWFLNLENAKGDIDNRLPIAGTVVRDGTSASITCDQPYVHDASKCVGKRDFRTDADLFFGNAGYRFTIGDADDIMEDAPNLYPDCLGLWGMAARRTGAILLNGGAGTFDPKRLRKGPVTLGTSETLRCEDVSPPEPGVSCTTTTHWKVSIQPAGKKGTKGAKAKKRR